MDFEVVAIGNELLLGFTVDSNSADIGLALAPAGARVVRRTTVGDTPTEIRLAVGEALQRTGRVITTGGLGPTKDDITKKTVAQLFGVPLDFDEDIWQSLVDRYAGLMRRSPESNRCQAEVPRGATVLTNHWGSAPGLWLEGEPGLVVMLPGVPQEMRNLMADEVVPRVRRMGAGDTVIASRVLRTAGIGESSLAEQMGDIEDVIAPVTLAYLPGEAWVDLRLTAWKHSAGESQALLERAAQQVRERAGEFCFGQDDDDLAGVVLEHARRAGMTLAVAESCTGGQVGQRLSAIPGSSDVFRGGVIAYHNDVKHSQLGVPLEMLEREGAVSEPVARAMAEGAAERLGADLAIAITGVAGPAGGTDDKPVGTVWHGYHVRGSTETKHRVYPGDRHGIQTRATVAALFGMLRRLGTGELGN
ncbi:MAG: competence/damage-inducible protein A [Gemmatimonadales bacterium]